VKRHDGAVFGKGIRKVLAMPPTAYFKVANCDQFDAAPSVCGISKLEASICDFKFFLYHVEAPAPATL
jgi:hypothetical protein